MGNKNSGNKNSFIDNSGQKFGRLTVIERAENYYNKKDSNNNKVKYRCLCECGNVVEVLKHGLISGKTKSCGCLKKELTSRRSWMGYEEISGITIGTIQRTAEYRKLEYNLSNEFLWQLYLQQNRKCALTGIDIVFARNIKDLQTASLDRIDNDKGYIEDNVQWVHKDINKLKWAWDINKFYKMCEDVTNFRKSIINKEDNDRLKG